MFGGVYVVPTSWAPLVHGTVVTLATMVFKPLVFRQIRPWPALAFINGGTPQLPALVQLFCVIHHSAYCSAVSAAARARSLSRVLPAILSSTPKLRNMLIAKMVTIINSSRLDISTMPRCVDRAFRDPGCLRISLMYCHRIT